MCTSLPLAKEEVADDLEARRRVQPGGVQPAPTVAARARGGGTRKREGAGCGRGRADEAVQLASWAAWRARVSRAARCGEEHAARRARAREGARREELEEVADGLRRGGVSVRVA